MAVGLKDIRKKIASVNNTKKTTRAMKLVSTSKLRKAQDLALRSKVFADRLNEVFMDMMRRMKHSGLDHIDSKFFDATRKSNVTSADIIFITADKGLCGGFNSMTIKEVLKLKDEYEQQHVKVRLHCIGKKGGSFFHFNQIPLTTNINDLSSAPNYDKAREFITDIINEYLEEKTDEVTIVYNGFKSLISQQLKVSKILPFAAHINAVKIENAEFEVLNIEPEDEENLVLDQLATKYIEYNMYYALIDSLAAEHSARMQAMDAATNNANDLVKSLTVSYNKARQESITTELVEINAGVEAMK
ncbi:ATP synthase F1 subunit gamma [Helicobacter sp. 11S02629-2]|uniref:ATP synthase F1 subunit gamma n=1 Tax=Helicobacter sp. 11S02629-2 TaxID=1476195 RepID=UPI000BA67152|nr:ATP synthase F1 subunit gamma [Helicobacter sp. 11S02629-2]PAF45906.1 F0F1 ATP synthase subunit gamma [Helicobacter sp. 11S02629-2]